MNTKPSPRKVTLAMIKGKSITTSVPVIHYHAADHQLEEIYPSTDEETAKSTGKADGISADATSAPLSCSESRLTHESDISENISESRSASAENILLEGTPPYRDPWKVLSDIRGKITKTFEEKLSEMKSDKRKRRSSRAESSSISESEDQGSVTPCDDRKVDKQVNEPSTTAIVHPRGIPVRYITFSGVKTGLKDKSSQDECVESGIEASEFSRDANDETVPCATANSQRIESIDDASRANLRQRSPVHLTACPKRINFKVIFSHVMKQLIRQVTYRSIAVLVAILCTYYVTSLPGYLLGLMLGVFATTTFYDMLTRVNEILTTLPEGKFLSRPVVPVLEIPAVEEHAAIERFQGWLNELPYSYEPSNYHVARTKSVFFRLEGNILRIMETRAKIPKKAVWDEPTHKVKFTERRIYNLIGAKVELVPHGLTRRRRWSKKYPICITVKKRALISSAALKCSVDEERSIGDYHCKAASKSNRKRSAKWERRRRKRRETCLLDSEGEEAIIRSRKGKHEEQGTGEEEEDSAGDDDDDNESFNQDSQTDDIGDAEDKYQFPGSEQVEECAEERGRKKQRGHRQEEKRDIRIRRNAKRDRIGNRCKSDKGGKEHRETTDGTKFEKQRLNVEKKSKVKGKRAVQGRIEEIESMEEWEQEKEVEDGDEDNNGVNVDDDDDDDDEDDDDDDDDDDDADDDIDDDFDDDDDDGDDDDDEDEDDDDGGEGDNDGDNKEEEEEMEKRENKVGIETEGATAAEMEKTRKREVEENVRQGEEEMEEWETIGGLSELKCLRNTFKKYSKNGKRIKELKIFVFARADREKEDWYRRLISAASRCVKKQGSSLFPAGASSISTDVSSTTQRTVTSESKACNSPDSALDSVPQLNYDAYMAKCLDVTSSIPESGFCMHPDDTLNTLWINCLIARILFDVHKCPETKNLIQDKIQRKLSSIKLPYFMECLLVSEVTIGQGTPIIRNVTKPVTNERGLWLDLDITYKGSLTMTVETKLNLMKLTRTGSVASNSSVIISAEKDESMVTRSPIFDSDMEDTPETSTEEDDTSRSQMCSTAAKEASPAQSSGKKFLSMVDKIAANKYFQHATELSYVRKAMEGVSNTEIRLMVTVSSIEGSLSINIPPAPSDRMWYGFKPVPKVTLTVKPAVGERTVNIVYITKWIETKLLREFEKLVVLPNMDDLVLPLCPNYPYTTMRDSRETV